MIRLLICDDSAEARRMLRTILAGDRELEIVGEASDGSEAIALAVDLQPDVVLMDVEMPVLDGVEATKRVREHFPATRIVALAGSDDLDDRPADARGRRERVLRQGRAALGARARDRRRRRAARPASPIRSAAPSPAASASSSRASCST